MNHKYLILLLFIFLVFLMGSVNPTVTNIFYNNTTGTQDHALLTNLSYDDSSHTGFQSSAALNDNVSALGYVKDISGKMNKSRDTFTNTTFMNITNGSYPQSISAGYGGTPFGVWIENETVRSIMALGGPQIWKLRTNDLATPSKLEAGYIMYSTPGSLPGILFYNSSLGSRINIYMTANGLKLEASNTASSNNAGGIEIQTQSNDGDIRVYKNLTVSGLVGSGNRPLCADPNGKIIICP